jgi:hypothetical protein
MGQGAEILVGDSVDEQGIRAYEDREGSSISRAAPVS